MKCLGSNLRPDPGNKPAGMLNQWKASATFPIPAARQETRCYSRQTGSQIMSLSGGQLHQPSHRSSGEVGVPRAYFYFPLSAKRTSVPLLLYEALPKPRTAANLAGLG
jgi:hypothetical protein